jgi:hypothetical protein
VTEDNTGRPIATAQVFVPEPDADGEQMSRVLDPEHPVGDRTVRVELIGYATQDRP